MADPRNPTLKDTVDNRKKRRAQTSGPKPRVKAKVNPTPNVAKAAPGLARRALGAAGPLGVVASAVPMIPFAEGVAGEAWDVLLDRDPAMRDPRRVMNGSMFTEESDVAQFDRSLRANQATQGGPMTPGTLRFDDDPTNDIPGLTAMQQEEAAGIDDYRMRLAERAGQEFGVDPISFYEGMNAVSEGLANQDGDLNSLTRQYMRPEEVAAMSQLFTPEYMTQNMLDRTDPEFLTAMEEQRTLAAQEPEVVEPEVQPLAGAPSTTQEQELPTFERGESTRTLRTRPQFLGSNQSFPGTVDATALSRQLERRANQIQQERNLARRDQQIEADRAERQFMEQIDPGGTLRRRARGNSDRAREAGQILSQRMRRGAVNQRNLFDNAQIGREADITSLRESDDIERLVIDGASQNVRQQNANTLARQTETSSDRLDFDIFRDKRDAPFDRAMTEQDRTLRAGQLGVSMGRLQRDLAKDMSDRTSKGQERVNDYIDSQYEFIAGENAAPLQRAARASGLDEIVRNNSQMSSQERALEMENFAVVNDLMNYAYGEGEAEADLASRYQQFQQMNQSQLKRLGIDENDFIPGTKQLTSAAMLEQLILGGDVSFQQVTNLDAFNPFMPKEIQNRALSNFLDGLWGKDAPEYRKLRATFGEKDVLLSDIINGDPQSIQAVTALIEQRRQRLAREPVER